MKRKKIFKWYFLCIIFVFAYHNFSHNLFNPKGRIVCEGRIFSLVCEDINKDSHKDIVVSDFLNPSRILFNNGELEFKKIVPLQTTEQGVLSGHGIALEDLNEDGIKDIFLVYNNFPSRVLFGDKNGKFTDSGQQIGKPGQSGTSLTLADIDNDKDLDAFVTYFQEPAKLYLNNGKGIFRSSGQFYGNDCCCIVAGDINNDKNIDIIIRQINDTCLILLNKKGTLILQEQEIGDKKGWGHMALSDIDKDSDLDLILANDVDEGSVWKNNGQGYFSRTDQKFNSGACLACGDIDNDGDEDVIIGNSLWVNNGKGKFERLQKFAFGWVVGLWLFDIDLDNDLDLFVSQFNQEKGAEYLELFLK